MAKNKQYEEQLPPSTGTGECTVTDKCFADFVAGAEILKTDAASAASELAISFQGKLSDVCDERRNYQKAQDTLNIYNGFYYCSVLSICKDIEQGQETVKRSTDWSAQTKTGFDKVLVSLKNIKTKLTNVKNLAGALETVVCDSCNTENKKKIAEKIGGDDELTDCLNAIKTMALDAEGAADQASETSVITAGVLAFTNVPSIKPFTDALKAKCEVLKKDVEDNVKNAGKSVEANQKALADALAQLSAAEAEWRRGKTVTSGIAQTILHAGNISELTPPSTPFEDIPSKAKQALGGSLKTPSTGSKPTGEV